MANHTAEAIRNLRDALSEGDAELAWTYIEPILRFPDSQRCSPDELAATWAYFEKAAANLSLSLLTPLISASREWPDDPATLLALGQGLLDYELHALAATPLTHAQELIGESSPLAGEISVALSSTHRDTRAPLSSTS